MGSLLRHLAAWQAGEDNDPESGLPHLAHISCNVRMLTYYTEHFPEGDDRFKRETIVDLTAPEEVKAPPTPAEPETLHAPCLTSIPFPGLPPLTPIVQDLPEPPPIEIPETWGLTPLNLPLP